MVTPPCDAALEAAVKAQEKKTKQKAPYFGASSRAEALELNAWKDIGMVWGMSYGLDVQNNHDEQYAVDFAKRDVQCYVCGDWGHIARDCPKSGKCLGKTGPHQHFGSKGVGKAFGNKRRPMRSLPKRCIR